MQFSMKLKPFLVWFVVLAVCGVVAWLACRPTPVIRFVAFQESKNGRLASFQIVNDSDSPFTVYGHGPDSPRYSYRISTHTGWQRKGLGEWCGTGMGLHTLAPHSVTEMQAFVPQDSPAAPFAVGIHFYRGTAEEVGSHPPSRFVEVLQELYARINPSAAKPEPTWSTVVQSP